MASIKNITKWIEILHGLSRGSNLYHGWNDASGIFQWPWFRKIVYTKCRFMSNITIFFLIKRLIFFPNAPPFHHRSLFFLNTFVRIHFCLCFYFGILFKPWDLIEFFIFKYFAIGYFSAKYSNTSAFYWTTLQNHIDNYIFVVCKPITWPISGAVDYVGISNGKIINCFCLSTHAVQNKSTIHDIVPTWPMKVFFFSFGPFVEWMSF